MGKKKAHSVRASRNPQNKRRERTAAEQRKRLIGLIVCLAVILLAIVVVCVLMLSDSGVNSKLMGKWRYNEYTAYEFYDDGKGYLCLDDVRYEYTYQVSSDKLTLDFTEDVVRDCEYTFRVDGNELTIVGGEGTDKGTYKLIKEN